MANLGDPDGCLASAQRALALATALEDVGLRVGATNNLADVYWQLSDYRRAAEVFEEGMLNRTCTHRAAAGALWDVSHPLRVCPCALGAVPGGAGGLWGGTGIRRRMPCGSPRPSRTPTAWPKPCRRRAVLSPSRGPCRRPYRCWNGVAGSQRNRAPLALDASRSHGRLGTAYALAGRIDEALPRWQPALEQTVAMQQPINYAPFAVWLGEGYVLAGRLDGSAPARAAGP